MVMKVLPFFRKISSAPIPRKSAADRVRCGAIIEAYCVRVVTNPRGKKQWFDYLKLAVFTPLTT